MKDFFGIPKHPREGDVCYLRILCPEDYETKNPEVFFFCHEQGTNTWLVKPIFNIKKNTLIFSYKYRNIEFMVLEDSEKDYMLNNLYKLKVQIIRIINNKNSKNIENKLYI